MLLCLHSKCYNGPHSEVAFQGPEARADYEMSCSPWYKAAKAALSSIASSSHACWPRILWVVLSELDQAVLIQYISAACNAARALALRQANIVGSRDPDVSELLG